MEDSTFAIFIVFACIWIVMGAIALIALLRADGQPIRFGQWGLVVALPIVIPLIAALAFGAFAH